MYKELFSKKKAAVFDLEGTIVDTHGIWLDTLSEILERLNADWINSENYLVFGANIFDFWEKLLENEKDADIKLPVSQLVDQTRTLFVEKVKENQIQPIDGFISFAKELKIDNKMTLGLATNTVKFVADEILNVARIQHIFDFKIYGDDVKKLKPDPEMYKKAINHLKLKNSAIIVFEDSVVGSTASVRADLDTIVVLKNLEDQENHSKKVVEFIPDYTSLINTTKTDKKEYYGIVVNSVKDYLKVS